MVGAFAVAACVSPPPPPPVPEVAGWDAVPGTGEAEARSEIELRERSDAAHAKVAEADLLFVDARLDAYLVSVVGRLEAGAGLSLPEAAPSVAPFVLRAPFRNAFVDAAGRIYLTTSLLAALENEAQLAGLLGHELAHFVARDDSREDAYRAVTTSTVHRMTLSRDSERAADARAVAWMSAAGYDAREMAAMLHRLQEGEPMRGGVVLAWESHPAMPERVREVRALAASLERAGAAEEADAADPRGRRAYESVLAPVLREAVDVELGANRLDAAWEAVERWTAVAPASADAFHAKGCVAARRDDARRAAPAVSEAWEHALELDPSHPDALRDLGLALRRAGDAERARELLVRYLEVAPEAFDRKLIERLLEREPAAR